MSYEAGRASKLVVYTISVHRRNSDIFGVASGEIGI